MTIVVAPSALSDVSCDTPGICANCRSNGAATEVAIVSALAPCHVALTWIVGKSTCGSGATGRNGNDAMPTNAIAAISKVVATGRRMNGSEIFMRRSRFRRWRDGDGRVVLQLVLPAGHDPIAVVEARRDDGELAGAEPDLDRP